MKINIMIIGCCLLVYGACSCSAVDTHRSSAGKDATRVLIKEISVSALPDREKFIEILRLGIAARGSIRGGPDVVFASQPEWYLCLLPFIDNSSLYGSYGIYLGSDISFLQQWSSSKKFERFEKYLKELGYLDDSGFAKKSKITKKDAIKIKEFAAKTYDE